MTNSTDSDDSAANQGSKRGSYGATNSIEVVCIFYCYLNQTNTKKEYCSKSVAIQNEWLLVYSSKLHKTRKLTTMRIVLRTDFSKP